MSRKRIKPNLWMADKNNKVKTPKDELEMLISMENTGYFMTPTMGGCAASYCGIEGIIAHFKHKEELIKYIYNL